jgi:hypothetical protein
MRVDCSDHNHISGEDMKAVLEFGVRGGFHVENLVIPSAKLAAKLAVGIISTLDEPEMSYSKAIAYYTVSRKSPRISWTSSEHFVSVTLLDGVDRGPASTTLWKKS